jgi:hypothetical protein
MIIAIAVVAILVGGLIVVPAMIIDVQQQAQADKGGVPNSHSNGQGKGKGNGGCSSCG